MARVHAEQWRERVKTWEASGKPAESFASSRGFNARRLQWWKWKFGREAGASRTARPSFVPVHAAGDVPAKARAGVDVTFASGIVVRIPAGFSARALAELIELVGALSC